MSSTNRGSERNEKDFYTTPIEPIELFLRAFMDDCPEAFEQAKSCRAYVLDPCAGGGEGLPMPYPAALQNAVGISPQMILTADIREDSPAMYNGRDYLAGSFTHRGARPYMVISNPPFSLAQEFIHKALCDVGDDGYVIMLLRLSFFGSQKRKAFFEGHMPERAYVHSKRISFIGALNKHGKPGTDSSEYIHAVWRKQLTPTYCKLKVI